MFMFRIWCYSLVFLRCNIWNIFNWFLKLIEKCSLTIKLRLLRQLKITQLLKVLVVKYTHKSYWKRQVSYFSGCLKESGNVFSSTAVTIYSAVSFRVLNTIFLKSFSVINRFFYVIQGFQRSRKGFFFNWYTMLCVSNGYFSCILFNISDRRDVLVAYCHVNHLSRSGI